MRYSKLFTKTLRQPPKDATTINHRLLTQAGFVEQLMAGVYTYLPLGLKVLRNIERIVREEMDAIGGQEILMPILHPRQNWEQTKGWNTIEVLFKLKSRTGKEYALGQSEEEVVTPLIKNRINTYKDLPLSIYQIHWKYRDELRAKSGILRGREFYMKDLYSFHESQKDFLDFYELCKKTYLKIFKRLGLTAKAAEASGGGFSEKISYEFMVLTDAGEDTILYCNACDFCINLDIAKTKTGELCPSCKKGKLSQAKASEVGNVFDLGQKYTKDFDITFTAADGTKKHPIMGCYGLGISRVMGVIVEKFHDERGIIWPKEIAPYQAHLVLLEGDDKKIEKQADEVCKKLVDNGISVLYDDRSDVSAGEKFADADLIGIPVRLVVSKKTGNKIEYKQRDSDKMQLLSLEEVLKKTNV